MEPLFILFCVKNIQHNCQVKNNKKIPKNKQKAHSLFRILIQILSLIIIIFQRQSYQYQQLYTFLINLSEWLTNQHNNHHKRILNKSLAENKSNNYRRKMSITTTTAARTKHEFMKMYEQGVTLLKQYKHQNDTLNKLIGQQQYSSSNSKKLQSQQSSSVLKLTKRLDEILVMLQQSYLDPQTARRIGTIKQQYKIQKDRRKHIQKQLAQQQLFVKDSNNNHSHINKYSNVMPRQTSERQSQMTGYNYHNQMGNSNNKMGNSNNPHQRATGNKKRINNSQYDEQQYDKQNTTSSTLNEQQLMQYDYQIECKLLQQRNKSLQQTQKRMNNVYNITKQTKQLVDYQGEHLDIIGDQIFKTKENVTDALEEIKQANKLSKQRRRRIVKGVSIVLFILVVVLIVLFMG